MRYEFAVAARYLIPRAKQLSVSIISLVSLLVISLVIWLALVFLSVTDGLEKNWIDKLVSISAPIRITPTEKYFKSYYHNIDSISAKSNFRIKSIKEKLQSTITDPYDEDQDSQIPSYFEEKEIDLKGNTRDFVKELNSLLNSIKGITTDPYEINFGQFKLNALNDFNSASAPSDLFASQMAYFSTFPESSQKFAKTLLPLSGDDAKNLIDNLLDSQDDETNNNEIINSYFDKIQISSIKTRSGGHLINFDMLPKDQKFKVVALLPGPQRLILCKSDEESKTLLSTLKKLNYKASIGTLEVSNNGPLFNLEDISWQTPLVLNQHLQLKGTINASSLKHALFLHEVTFDTDDLIQSVEFKASLPLASSISFGKINPITDFDETTFNIPPWIHKENGQYKIIENDILGDPIVLSKHFKEHGIEVGHRGTISYNAALASGIQEMRLPVWVAGFYDSGIAPLGSKLVLSTHNLVTEIGQSSPRPILSGFQVWFDDPSQTLKIKKAIETKLNDSLLSSYFKVESFHDYDFAKDLVEQLQSDKLLFSLMAMIIILVACSNIISMLILLVNDKKKEIGILQSMGASPKSIALIFGTCGVFLGLLSSLLGTLAAYWTLSNIQVIVDFLSFIQGHNAFNQAFFGESLPNKMSNEALSMVWIATSILSLLAGLIPALKASSMKPTEILRSE
jgi:lipoprotein-releasing system permease protein